MRDVNVAEGIVPLGEFKARASQLLKELGDSDEPLIITQNGRPAAVVLSPAAFESLRERQRALEAVAEGIGDAEEGRVYDHKSIRTWLTSWGTDAEVEPPR